MTDNQQTLAEAEAASGPALSFADLELHPLILDAISDAGWHFSQALIWVKQAFVPGPADYHY